MELHMHSHRWEHRLPDWAAAAVGGFVAGAVVMVLELIWSSMVLGTDHWSTSHMVAAITMGRDALQSSGFSVGIVATALVTHYVLGIIFALILAVIIAPFHFDSSAGMLTLVGAAFGLLLYLINFYGMVNVFPWFVEMRGWAALATHLVFGIVAALMYHQLEQRGTAPSQ